MYQGFPLITWVSLIRFKRTFACFTSSVVVVQLLSCVQLFVTPWTAAFQASVLASRTLRVCSNLCPLSQRCHPTISSSSPPSPLALNLCQHQGLSQRVVSSYQVPQKEFPPTICLLASPFDIEREIRNGRDVWGPTLGLTSEI